ncbi:MAG TPA: hypothetical protein VN939_00320 [Chthoniobacterales bacterium]|nr:hypothetical protein [Chthoniobacterales bacterium]
MRDLFGIIGFVSGLINRGQTGRSKEFVAGQWQMKLVRQQDLAVNHLINLTKSLIESPHDKLPTPGSLLARGPPR